MKVIKRNFDELTEKDLLKSIRDNDDTLGYIYMKHKDYCLYFLNSRYFDDAQIEDIYQDAIIVLREKSFTDHFELTCSIQTYLNSICYNQLRVRSNAVDKTKLVDDTTSSSFFEKYDDWLSPVESDLNSDRVKILTKCLVEMQSSSETCYKILTLYYYYKYSMENIARKMGQANADVAKNQKARCQKKLKEIVDEKIKKNSQCQMK